MTEKNKKDINTLLSIMQDLRNVDTGCPWDIKQTHHSLIPYAIEESYEVIDAIERNDSVDLCDELGDLLLQVVFHSQIASENNVFTFSDVVQSICDKMHRRHPHVFDKQSNLTEEEVNANWHIVKDEEAKEKIAKKQKLGLSTNLEKEHDYLHMKTIAPLSAPALMRGQKISKKAVQKYGFKWNDVQGIYDKINEELNEVANSTTNEERLSEIGDVLFSVACLANHYKIDAEQALSHTNAKFVKRFNTMMALVKNAYPHMEKPYPIDLMEKYWQNAKKFD